MSIPLLALRERARRWVRIQAVKLGVVCIHAIDPAAWRPAASDRYRGVLGLTPARLCRYCETLERMTEADFYARFGRPFNGGRA